MKSPELTKFKTFSTYIADFNAPLIVATNARTLSANPIGKSAAEAATPAAGVLEGNNGKFSLVPAEGGGSFNAIYRLKNRTTAKIREAWLSAAGPDGDLADALESLAREMLAAPPSPAGRD